MAQLALKDFILFAPFFEKCVTFLLLPYQVAELINMDELMTADEAAAERVYQEEQRREFTESRAAKEMQVRNLSLVVLMLLCSITLEYFQDKAQAEGKHVAGEDETKKVIVVIYVNVLSAGCNLMECTC